MRSKDLTVGELYALKSAREVLIKVRVLDTPPEMTRQGRVRVRFEAGIKAGKEADIPTRRIERPWEGERPTTRATRRPRLRVVEISPLDAPSSFVPGAKVTIPDQTDKLVWEIVSVQGEREAATAMISSEIFGQPRGQTVPLALLRLAAREHKPPQDLLIKRDSNEYESFHGADDPPLPRWSPPQILDLAPSKPVRELEVVLQNVLFMPNCLAFYHRHFAADTPWRDRNDTLREQIRRKGYLEKGVPPGTYGSIRVNRRFDVVLNHKPTPESPCEISWLKLPRKKSRSKRTKAGGGGRKAA